MRECLGGLCERMTCGTKTEFTVNKAQSDGARDNRPAMAGRLRDGASLGNSRCVSQNFMVRRSEVYGATLEYPELEGRATVSGMTMYEDKSLMIAIFRFS